MNHILEKIIDKSKKISEDFNVIMAMSMDMESFIFLMTINILAILKIIKWKDMG